MNLEIEKLMIIIRDLANRHYSREYKSIEEAIKEVKSLTRSAWNTNNSSIISELTKLNTILKRDYQRFWFDCLRFPPTWPDMKDLMGKPYYEDFNGLPSDFNEISYHDSIINGVETGEDFQLNIDLIETWNDEEHGWRQQGRQAILSFIGISLVRLDDYISDERIFMESQLPIEELKGVSIYSITEVPPIDYICKELSLNIESVKGKRIFVLDALINDFERVVIVCDSWSISRQGEGIDIGYAFKANG